MQIVLNGRPRAIESAATVRRLLEEMDYPPEVVAVQVNDDIVPRSRFADTRLAEGDRVEVITFAAGG